MSDLTRYRKINGPEGDKGYEYKGYHEGWFEADDTLQQIHDAVENCPAWLWEHIKDDEPLFDALKGLVSDE